MIHHLNVAILGNQQLFTDGLGRIIKDMQFIINVHLTANYSQLCSVITSDTRWALFLDVNLQHIRNDGFSVCRQLKQHYPTLCIALLSDYPDKTLRLKARNSGASAYFTKNSSPYMLEVFLADVTNGRLNGFVADSHATAKETGAATGFELKEHLSNREIEVFECIARCCDNSEIQQQLGISYNTLRTHRDNIIKKLHLKNEKQIIRFAYMHNLVE